MEKPAKRRTNHVVDRLGMSIIAGIYGENTLLPNDQVLCAEFSVSRTIIREALRVLQAKGLVYSVPRAGSFAAPQAARAMLDADVLGWMIATYSDLTADQKTDILNDIIDLRLMSDPGAAALAASRAGAEQRQILSARFATLRGAQTATDRLAAETAFIDGVLESCQNRFIHPHRALNSASHEFLHLLTPRYTDGFDLRIYEALTRALINRDAAEARLTMQRLVLSLYPDK